MCAGNHMVKSALAIVEHTRLVLRSSINVTVAHCGELKEDNIDILKAEGVDVLNICAFEFGMDAKKTRGRLRSWFCKAGALLVSPYDETMLVDIDVVWFKNPEVLFESPAYRRTGALFFRDRVTHDEHLENSLHLQILSLIKTEAAFNVTAELAALKASEFGESFFWRHVVNASAPIYSNFQDSSVVLLDKSSHPQTLKMLMKLLPTFDLGWGDKEIYWVAATIADEPFSFEPFAAASYADCGLLMHYDPNDEDDVVNAEPIYINAEWILESMHSVGDGLALTISNAMLVNSSVGYVNQIMMNERKRRMCSCEVFGCKPVPRLVDRYLLWMQWQRLSRKATSRKGHDCISIYKRLGPQISEMMREMVVSGDCPRLGCAFTPIPVNTSLLWFSESFCVPISFSEHPEEDMYDKAVAAQLPVMPKDLSVDGTLVKDNGKVVYLIANSTRRAIPDFATFVKLGFDFVNVRKYATELLNLVPLGDPMEPYVAEPAVIEPKPSGAEPVVAEPA